MKVDLPGLRRSALAATILLAVMIPLTASSAAVETLTHSLNRAVVLGVRYLNLVGLLVTAVAFMTWLYRARKNLTAAGVTGLRWDVGWTIGGWLIPVGFLVIPLLVVREVDRAVGPRRPAVFACWAAFWTLGELADFALDRADGISSAALPAMSGCLIGAAVCAMLLVRRITLNQVEAFTPPE